MSGVTIRRPAERTRVAIAPGLLGRMGPALRRLGAGPRPVIVTDRTVARLHAPRLVAALRREGFAPDVAVIPPGERSKSLETVAALYRRWSRVGVDRDTLVVALGGGVVSDVAGFAAATYARGLDWVVVPTTLLAQADACIGGKVGVNLPAGKNLVGAYHHPRAVFTDPDLLRTLSGRAFRSGLAEIAKMGFIRRPGLLTALGRLARERRLRDQRALVPILAVSVREKGRIVERDERDRGLRRTLNFGHTVGHALEAAYGYRRYLHGEAISLGMVAALRLSVLEARLQPDRALEGERLLRALGLPIRLHAAPTARFWRALDRDKKRGRARVRVVLSPAVGTAKVFELPSLTSLRRVLLTLVGS